MALNDADDPIAPLAGLHRVCPSSITPQPLDVRAIDVARLLDARHLAAALDATRCGGLIVSAHVETGSPSDGCWVAGAAVLVQLDPAGDAPLLTPDRPAALAEALDRLDPVWDRVERALGVPVEFDRTTPGPPPGAVAVRLSLTGAHTGHLRLVPLVPVPPVAAAPANPAARLPARLDVDGPRLSVEDAATLAAGDLLILATGAWRSRLAVPGRPDGTGTFEASSGRWMSGGATLGDLDEASDGAAEVRGFAVSTTLTLPTVDVTVGELEALRPGSTLLLGPVTAGLEVRLGVGGRAVATGELVRLGEHYAMLITEGAGEPPAAPPTEV